jgi:hypothetical protein
MATNGNMSASMADVIPFDYVVVTGSIAASGSAQTTLTLAPDSSFELHLLEGRSSLDGVTDIRPNNFSCQITIQSTGRQLSNLRVPQNLLAGTAENGPMFRRPILLSPNTVLLFDFLNLSGASANTITLALRGYKLFNSR